MTLKAYELFYLFFLRCICLRLTCLSMLCLGFIVKAEPTPLLSTKLSSESARDLSNANSLAEQVAENDLEVSSSTFSNEEYFENISALSLVDHLSLRMNFEGYHYTSSAEGVTVLKFKNYLRAYHFFTPNIDLNMEFLLQFGQGSVQSYFSSRSENLVDISPYQIYLRWKIMDFIHLKQGILNQDFLKAPTLISDRDFVGLRQEIYWIPKVLSSYFDEMIFAFQETIPSTRSDLTYYGQLAGTGGFFTGSLFFKKEDVFKYFKKGVNLEGGLILFGYRGLSSAAAIEGNYQGNTSGYQVGPDVTLKYPFYGFHSNTRLLFPVFSNLDFEFKNTFLWNLGVPITMWTNQEYSSLNFSDYLYNKRDKALTLFFGLHMKPSGNITLIPSVEYFYVQSDASPAAYNESRYGYSNHWGFIIQLKALLNRYNVFLNFELGFINDFSTFLSVKGDESFFKFSIGNNYATN